MTKEERSEMMLWRYALETPEQKLERSNRMIGVNKGRKHTPEAIEKIKAARKKQHQVFDEKAKINMSNAQKKYWGSLSKEERERKVKIFINAPKKKIKNTSIELKVKKQLDDLNLKYKQQKYCYNKRINKGFYIDFYLPDYDVMIECNGTYWHSKPKRIERDLVLKDAVENGCKIKHKNLKLITLWDWEINSNKNIVWERLESIISRVTN